MESTSEPLPNQTLSQKAVDSPTPPANQMAKYEQNSQAEFVRRNLENKFDALQAAIDDLNGLSEFKPITVEVRKIDKQVDVLRRTYETYAKQAGLSDEGQKEFVATMLESGDALIHHNDDAKQPFTPREFLLKQQQGKIEMTPTAGQLAELRRIKTAENEVICIDETKAYGETGNITFTDKSLATQDAAVMRRYLQQNGLGGDFYFAQFGDEVAQQALNLGIKPSVVETGTNAAGETTYQVRLTPEDAEKLQQVKTEYQTKKAEFTVKLEQGRENTNQMFADQGRVLWNSGVNIVEGTINTAIDAALSKGGQDPIYLTLPEILKPHVDFSGAKSEYKSEMMRRNVDGVVDGDGIKAGQVIETGVTIAAPIVVGVAIKPAVPPQTLETLGALPEVETVAQTPQAAKTIYKGVEITDAKGASLGEFDGIEGDLFVEDKSAQGLSTLNPKTGQPFQTAESWSQKQIFDKTVTRIENLAKATSTRATVSGTSTIPDLSKIQGIRRLEFRIESSTPEIQKAVTQQIQLLQTKYPSWTFTVKYGR